MRHKSSFYTVIMGDQIDGIDWATQAMSAAEQKLTAASKNLANISTDGFAQLVVQVTARSNGLTTKTSSEATPGTLRNTGRPLDIAMVGPGAFHLAAGRSGGGEATTRIGSFFRDGDGYIVDRAGRFLLDGQGKSIRVGDDVEFGEDGSVRTGGKTVARLDVPGGTLVHSGFLEGSAVDSVSNMMRVIDANRSFESNEKALKMIDNLRAKESQIAELKG